MYHDNHQSTTYLVCGIKEIFHFLPLSCGLLSDGFFSKKYIQLKKLHKTIIKKNSNFLQCRQQCTSLEPHTLRTPFSTYIFESDRQNLLSRCFVFLYNQSIHCCCCCRFVVLFMNTTLFSTMNSTNNNNEIFRFQIFEKNYDFFRNYTKFMTFMNIGMIF